MKKYKIYLLFTAIFLLLASITLITVFHVEDNISFAAMAYAQPTYTGKEVWGEKYLPYTDTELTELKTRIVTDTAEDGHVFLVTRKTGIFNSLVAPKNWSVIWTPDCLELKKLISTHKLDFQEYKVDGNTYYLVLDLGRIYSKSNEIIKYELGKEPLVNIYGEINQCYRGHSSSKSKKTIPIIVTPTY